MRRPAERDTGRLPGSRRCDQYLRPLVSCELLLPRIRADGQSECEAVEFCSVHVGPDTFYRRTINIADQRNQPPVHSLASPSPPDGIPSRPNKEAARSCLNQGEKTTPAYKAQPPSLRSTVTHPTSATRDKSVYRHRRLLHDCNVNARLSCLQSHSRQWRWRSRRHGDFVKDGRLDGARGRAHAPTLKVVTQVEDAQGLRRRHPCRRVGVDLRGSEHASGADPGRHARRPPPGTAFLSSAGPARNG